VENMGNTFTLSSIIQIIIAVLLLVLVFATITKN
jgi:hypothetical protein